MSNTLKNLRLMAFDVDGVLTDGRLYFNDRGEEMKAFNSLDGHGLKLLAQRGVTLAIITGRRSPTVAHRAQNLGITHLYQGVENKREAMFSLLSDLRLAPHEAGFMGDDVIDLPAMLCCGFSAAPANAHPLVAQHATWQSQLRGGEGAVRELCDYLLTARGEYDAAMADYLSTDRP